MEVFVFMVVVVIFIVLMVIVMVLGISLLVKYKEIIKVVNVNEKCFMGFMDSVVEGVIMINLEGIVLLVNLFVIWILGWIKL